MVLPGSERGIYTCRVYIHPNLSTNNTRKYIFSQKDKIKLITSVDLITIIIIIST